MFYVILHKQRSYLALKTVNNRVLEVHNSVLKFNSLMHITYLSLGYCKNTISGTF